MQEGWLRAWQKLHQFRGGRDDEETRAMLHGWIGQIMRRVGLNAARDRAAQRRAPQGRKLLRIGPGAAESDARGPGGELVAPEPSPSSLARTSERAQQVQAAIGGLADPADQAIVRMRCLEGLSLRDVAQRVGLAYSAARERYQSCLGRLEQALGELDA